MRYISYFLLFLYPFNNKVKLHTKWSSSNFTQLPFHMHTRIHKYISLSEFPPSRLHYEEFLVSLHIFLNFSRKSLPFIYDNPSQHSIFHRFNFVTFFILCWKRVSERDLLMLIFFVYFFLAHGRALIIPKRTEKKSKMKKFQGNEKRNALSTIRKVIWIEKNWLKILHVLCMFFFLSSSDRIFL